MFQNYFHNYFYLIKPISKITKGNTEMNEEAQNVEIEVMRVAPEIKIKILEREKKKCSRLQKTIRLVEIFIKMKDNK